MRKIILAGALFIISAATNASAEAPNLFTYQGRLKEGGQAVSGNRSVEIKLCPVETGGVCETTGAQPVAVSNGLFRSTFTIPAAVNFGTGSWWLEIWVGGDQLTPRERLTSNAYSLFSATAAYAENISAAAGSEGVYISSNLYVTGGKYYGDGSQLQNLPVSGGAVAKTGDAMTGQLTLYGSTLTVGGNAFSVGGGAFKLEGGKIGIGTVAPSGILEINGTDNPQLLLTDLSGDVTFAMRYSNGAPRHILGVPYYNDRVVLTNRAAPFPSQPDSALLLWDSGVTTLQMGTGGYLSFVAGTATEKARFTPQGNFGIGTTAPLYRLVVSSAAGEAGNMIVISTGTSDVIRLTGAGEIYANYYHGDGSQLSGITATSYTGTLPITNGGTGGTDAATARTNLGLGALAALSAVGSGEITDGSIANADLAGSIADSKINAITTAGKVDGSAITNLANLPAGAGVIPSANMPATISYLGGDISGAEIVDDTIVDADINSAAAISISKLAASGTLGASVLVSSVSISAFYSAPEVRSGLGLAVGTDVLAPNGDASSLTGVVHSNGDEAIAGLKVFTTTVSVNHSVLVKGNYALMLSTNIGYGGGLRHDQSGNETMVMAVRNANSKIYLATGYDVTPNAGGALALPASPEITVFNGMVGIKDTTPNSELDVTGQVNATGGLCIGGNCKTSWSSVDNLGDHTATQALNLAGYSIHNVSTLTVTGSAFSVGGSTLVVKNGMTGINVTPEETVYYNTNNGNASLVVGGTVRQRPGAGAWVMSGAVIESTMATSAQTSAFMAALRVEPKMNASAGYANGMDGIVVDNWQQIGGNYAVSAAAINLSVPTLGADCRDGILIRGTSGSSSPGCDSGTQVKRGIVEAGADYNFFADKTAFWGGAATPLVPKNAVDINGAAAIGTYAGNNTAPANSLIVSGLAGIGTVSPDQKLTVAGNISQAGIIISSGTGNNYFAGNVGIGIVAPTDKLNVLGGNVVLEKTSGDMLLSVKTGASANSAEMRLGSNNLAWSIGHSGDASSHKLSFQYYNGAWSTPAVLTTDGKFGIGTIAPANPLEVNGVIKSLAGGFTFPDGTNMTTAAGVGTGYASATDITMAADTDANGTGILTFATKGSERMRVDNDGNVGVGLAAPATRLDVQAAGTGDAAYTQIWRDSGGVIRASMTASGKLFADISAVAGGGDNLGNHNASNNLQLNWNNIYTVSTITAAGDITAARYQIDGSTVLSVLPGLKSLGIGVGAGLVSQANENTFVGYNAGFGNTSGAANTFIGALAGGTNSNGSNNTFVGPYAGNSNSGGNRNSFYGVSSGFSNDLGNDNAFYGAEAGRNNTGGSYNTALGIEAMKGTAGNVISGVTAVGYQAGAALTTGNYNTLIGHQAGDTLTTGTGNIVIGSGQDATASTISNELNIGGLLRGNLNAGTIGIGFTNTIPLAALDVKSTGTAANIYAQIWRDSGGAVVASMTSTGLLNVNSIAAGAFSGKFVPVYALVTGGDASTTNQTLSDIAGLSVALSASAVYEFEAQLSCGSSADSNGNQYGVNFDAAGSSVESIMYGDTGATMNSERINSFNTATSSYLGAPSATGGILIKGLITTTANPGNLTIQHLKVTAGTSTVYAGSYLKVTRIN